MLEKKRILIAPLNWGLGHASRCIPLIHQLLEKEVEVFIASDGEASKLLKKEFPRLKHIHLADVSIRYPKGKYFAFYFLLKFPSLIQSIKKENKLLAKIVKEQGIQAVISDNRYGLYHKEIPSILITHQLYPRIPFFSRQVHTLVAKLVDRFNYCWVPDFSGQINLSGRLSHRKKASKNVRFIGPLSRFTPMNKDKDYVRDILIVLSGPEPKRTDLEEKLKQQLMNTNYSVLLVQGKVEKEQCWNQISDRIHQVNFLKSEGLEKEIYNSEWVICRSGYSSVMDLVSMGKKALLIPTRGQTEQEYLAEYLFEKKLFYTVKEDHLDLEKNIPDANKFKRVTLDVKLKGDFLDELLAQL